MKIHSSARLLLAAGLIGTAACASNSQNDDTAATPRTDDVYTTTDTAMVRTDTTGGYGGVTGDSANQNPPGYRGMERDTTMFPQSDTTGAGRGTGVVTPTDPTSGIADTAGFAGMERDTSSSSSSTTTAEPNSGTTTTTTSDPNSSTTTTSDPNSSSTSTTTDPNSSSTSGSSTTTPQR